MGIGEIFGGQPTSTKYAVTPVTITDVQGFDFNESGTNFAHYGDDLPIAQDGGGNPDATFGATLRTRNIADAYQPALQVHALVPSLVGVFAKKGTASTDLTVTALVSRVNSRNLSGDDRKEASIGFDIFSTDGTTWPITYATS